jgi:hypothetical protein
MAGIEAPWSAMGTSPEREGGKGKRERGAQLGAAWGTGAARGHHGEGLQALLPAHAASVCSRVLREEENSRKEEGERRRKRKGRKGKEKKRNEKGKIWKTFQI